MADTTVNDGGEPKRVVMTVPPKYDVNVGDGICADGAVFGYAAACQCRKE
jgi:hypothetical protein